ncbi:Exonuclease RNase T and DNA polymerase III [Sulfuricurvum kujiense DSM 16994]|uniref:Exonuclease RNase T and DNA polymerase III n=1 Tax=Sulfuricurvum kujiense (strain ATCC BAA-921 / DSM 16994 / JCM 11577 / YK-1) TaxID=709032 RepID=E4U0X0_SULKY|nr:3'-5' exonuclease [Sulfuricurvum kujiense]ADR34372.1 Exonuclease RNase T and DNA polymerase III [Sulfuricurvum kujiense DSM 16994]
MRHTIILDTETTGAGEVDRICQLSYLVCDEKGEILELHNDLCTPPLPISFEAMAIHHITPEMLTGAPKCIETSAFNRLAELNTPDNLMVIQNAEFDLGMLAKEGMGLEMKLVDTFRVLRAWHPLDTPHGLQFKRYQWGLYHKEQPLIDKLGIEIKAHDALGDVIVLKHLYEKLLESHNAEGMIELCSKPIILDYVPFGKHKGKRFEEVALEARNDLKYMLENFDLDSDLRATLLHHMKATKGSAVITIGFGKYRGKTPAEVVQSDPGYLTWLLNNAERLDDETREAINNVLNA